MTLNTKHLLPKAESRKPKAKGAVGLGFQPSAYSFQHAGGAHA
jgi:hypothetical protein